MSSLTTNCRRYFQSCMIVLLVLGVTEEEEEEEKKELFLESTMVTPI